MLIDHIGIVFYPDSIAWRIVGRIAFPIYAYCIVQGCLHTTSKKKYLIRLSMLALVSQLPYMWSLQPNGINVIGTFVICLGVLLALDRKKLPLIANVAVVAAAIALLEAVPFSYGAYALLLILMYRYLPKKTWIATHVVLTIAFYFPHTWSIQMFSVIPTLYFVYGASFTRFVTGLRVPLWVWRSFYPGHLLALALLAWMYD